MLKDKNFTTFEEQIKILKGRNLIIEDEEATINALKRYGYYNIINGYKDPYIDTNAPEEKYIRGTTFARIFALYTLDRDLRSVVMQSMQEVEDHLKAATAHIVAETYTAEEALYLNKRNYRQGKKINGSNDYSIDQLFRKFDKIINDDNLLHVKHAREKHGNVPPWILLKELSFGNIVNFVKLQKGPQKRKILTLLSGFPEVLISSNNDVFNLLMDLLFVSLDYRNCAAHGGRLYNFMSKSKFRYNNILHPIMNISTADYRRGMGKTGIPVLIEALNILDDKKPRSILKEGVDFRIKKHIEKFPADEEYLSQFLPMPE